MDTYIYQADIHCADCAAKIKASLDADGLTPADPEDETSFDSDDYPKGPSGDGGGEADSFQHCAMCGVFLDNPLSRDGIAHTIDHLEQYIDDNGGNAQVLDEWAEALASHGIRDKHQQFVLKAYNQIRTLEKKLAAIL